MDRNSGKGIGITMWEDEDADAGARKPSTPRARAIIEAMGGTVPPVEEFEVVASDM